MTYVPVHVTAGYGDTELGIGTAFFYAYDGREYLITNWHNVTGRRPRDHKIISKTGAIPDNLVVRFPYKVTLDNGAKAFKWVPKVLSLYEDANRVTPIWWEHPDHGSSVDAVAIGIEELHTTEAVVANAESLDLAQLQLLPGMDVFVLGYPLGITGGGRFPIWKRGSIASEPDVHIDGLPQLYIDTATRSGMSGAPVYAQESGFWFPEGSRSFDDAVFGKGQRFLGVYSGRVGDDPFLAQLGIVWKEEAIRDIVKAKRRGLSSFSIASR